MNQQCKSCRSSDLVDIFSLGTLPLANSFLRQEELNDEEEKYPLDLQFCRSCSLVQLKDIVAPEKLFSNYLYLSSFSDTVLGSAKELCQRLAHTLSLGSGSRVIEIASNDGYLLKNYVELGIPVLGIEPAQNIAALAESRGIPSIPRFFNKELARELSTQGKTADAIHANNVLAHVPDLNDFVRSLYMILKADGVAVLEFPYLRNLIEGCQFDTIYHEHVFYFSIKALHGLFSRNELHITDIELIPLHGGSLRIFVKKQPDPHFNIQKWLEEEEASGMHSSQYYAHFFDKISHLKRELVRLLDRLKSEGKTIASYGASAKSTILLNFFGIGCETIDFIVDRSPIKQGLYTPGTHIPILHPDELQRRRPDYVLLLAWNFWEEVLEQQQAYRHLGGQFIVPIPELAIK